MKTYWPSLHRARSRQREMKILIGIIVAFLVGAGCRFFDIPVPSPPVLPGALLVVAMTLGYSATDRALTRRARLSTTGHLCGGPTGTTAAGLRRRHDNRVGRALG
jgi:XapX domain-containing protein